MARTRKVGLSEYGKHFRWCRDELVVRDLLVHDFLKFPFDQLCSGDLLLRRTANQQHVRLRQQIARKWLVDVIPIPPPYEQLQEELRDAALESLEKRQPWGLSEYMQYCKLLFPKGVRPTRVLIRELSGVLAYTFNRGCVGSRLAEVTRSEANDDGFWYREHKPTDWELTWGTPEEDKQHTSLCLESLGLSLDDIHTVNVEVNTAYITGRNLQDIMTEMKKILRTVFRHTARQDGALNFLLTITPKTFLRAITAYDLHMCEGLTFAKIARRKKWSPDQVERNVKRIYRAVHRKDYTARRRRIDTPAEGIELYHCDKHTPNKCPEGCKYMNDWLTKFNRTAPTDTTGSGRRAR